MEHLELYNRIERAGDKFWRKVNKGDGCWEWEGTLNYKGYGVFALQEKRLASHRVAFQLFHREAITKDDFVCHKCDNPKCCNPDHLFLGTHTDNMRDMTSKSRHPNQSKTHCPRGHDYTEENTYINKKGSRICRACARLGKVKALHSGLDGVVDDIIDKNITGSIPNDEELRRAIRRGIEWGRTNPR